MKNTVKPELLPCPFCGGHNLEIANTHTPSFWVQCNDCEAQVSGGYFKGPQRDTKFSYSDDPQGPYEAGFNDLHPEYKKAALSAIHAWNNRVAPPASTAIAARVIKQAAGALEPFALISSEGVIQQESGHVTVTTCAEYFHLAHQALSELAPANAEAELEALMMKVAEEVAQSRGALGVIARHDIDYRRNQLRAIVRRVLDEMKEN